MWIWKKHWETNQYCYFDYRNFLVESDASIAEKDRSV